jgi:hypothetical protein
MPLFEQYPERVKKSGSMGKKAKNKGGECVMQRASERSATPLPRNKFIIPSPLSRLTITNVVPPRPNDLFSPAPFPLSRFSSRAAALSRAKKRQADEGKVAILSPSNCPTTPLTFHHTHPKEFLQNVFFY